MALAALALIPIAACVLLTLWLRNGMKALLGGLLIAILLHGSAGVFVLRELQAVSDALSERGWGAFRIELAAASGSRLWLTPFPSSAAEGWPASISCSRSGPPDAATGRGAVVIDLHRLLSLSKAARLLDEAESPPGALDCRDPDRTLHRTLKLLTVAYSPRGDPSLKLAILKGMGDGVVTMVPSSLAARLVRDLAAVLPESVLLALVQAFRPGA